MRPAVTPPCLDPAITSMHICRPRDGAGKQEREGDARDGKLVADSADALLDAGGRHELLVLLALRTQRQHTHRD